MVKPKSKTKKKKLAKTPNDDEDYEDMDEGGLETGATAKKGAQEVYLPGDPLKEDEELVREDSAYEMFHEAQTGKCVTEEIDG